MLIQTDFPSFSDIRERTLTFGGLLRTHIKLHWLSYVLLFCVLTFLKDNYRLAFNSTPSLPVMVFYVHLNEPVAKGDYVSFNVGLHRPHFPATTKFTKLVAGVPGDKITVIDRMVYVNGTAVGYAQEKSTRWAHLEPIAPITVGPGQFYVLGLHKDSLDSRYAQVGLITQDEVIGRAFPIW